MRKGYFCAVIKQKSSIMKQNTKDWIQYASAIALIVSAIAMGFISFFLTKEIGAGPLTYIGEALSAALGIFGVAAFMVNQVTQFKTEVRSEFKKLKEEEERKLSEITPNTTQVTDEAE